MEAQALIDKDLYVATEDGRIDTIEALLCGHQTPDINSVHGPFLETALHVAASRLNLAIIKYLISKGANQQIRNATGRTAAHNLCFNANYLEDREVLSNDRIAMLKLLFDHDRSLMDSKEGTSGYTCLHIAASAGDVKVVQWLLDIGVDATIRDHSQNTAWDVAIDNLFWRKHQLTSSELESRNRAYRAFVRKEVKYGTIDTTLGKIRYEKVTGLEVYEIEVTNVVDLYILLEYLMYLAPLEQACQQIRQELCHFVVTGNRRGFREASCNFGIQGRLHDVQQEVVFESACNKDMYESFKASLMVQGKDAAPPATDSDTVHPALPYDSQKTESQKALRESVHGIPTLLSKPDQKMPGQIADYLSVVMPSICLSDALQLGLSRIDIVRQFKYRRDDKADLQGYHSCLTVDEYCYPALSDEILTRRNADQVMERASEELYRSLVVIDQVWVWLAQDVLIFTSLSGGALFQPASYESTGSSKYSQVGHLLADRVDNPDCDSIFDAFQNYLVMLAERLSSYIDREGVESMMIGEEKEFYHNINDVREELSMLRRVLSQQEEVWRTFASNAWPEIWADCQNGRVVHSSSDSQNKIDMEEHRALSRLIMRPRLRIQKSQRRITQLDEDAERVERSISNLLDLKQKYASLQEAHATAVMSTAVFGFTIITIIFTPLSFVVSLFALPIDRFQNNQIPSRWSGDAGMYSTNYIGTWAATASVVSIFLTVLAMWLALEYGLKYRLTLKVWVLLKSLHDKIYSAHRQHQRSPTVQQNVGKDGRTRLRPWYEPRNGSMQRGRDEEKAASVGVR